MDTASAERLSALMDFGTVIATGAFPGARPDMRTVKPYVTPESVQYVDLDADGGAPDPEAPDGWEYLTGFTGQYGYSGPIMHASELIGGRLAEHILTTPGYYVAVMIEVMPRDNNEDPEPEAVGWGVLHLID